MTAYRNRLELQGLPTAALEAVRSSPSLGAVVARQLRLPELLTNVQFFFMSGMGYVFYALSGVALFACLLAALRVPRHHASRVPETRSGLPPGPGRVRVDSQPMRGVSGDLMRGGPPMRREDCGGWPEGTPVVVVRGGNLRRSCTDT